MTQARSTLILGLSDGLPGPGNLEHIQRLLLSQRSRRALRDQLETLLSTPAMLGRCCLKRAKFKPGRLTAYYDAFVRMNCKGGYCVRPIAVTWASDEGTGQRWGSENIGDIQAEAVTRGVAAPFRRLTASLPKWSMQVRVSPLDADFPQLVRLFDERYVGEMLKTAYHETTTASQRCQYKITSIRYRPGQRHVLRFDSVDAVESVFAKLCTAEEGRRVFRVTTQAGEWLRQNGDGVTAVRPLAHVVEDRVVLYRGLAGMPLSDRLRNPCGAVAGLLERAGAALRTLHYLPPAIAGPLELHPFAAEALAVERASAYIGALLPSLKPVIEALLGRMRELYRQQPHESPTFTHGDFKSEHVWIGPSGFTLIDFDSSHLGDPALDVGKFLAHLRWWHATRNRPGVEPAQERFLAGYAPGVSREHLVRARLYEALELIKVAARRVPLFAPDWVCRMARLIALVQALMNELDITLGFSGALRLSPELKKQHPVRCTGDPQPSHKGGPS